MSASRVVLIMMCLAGALAAAPSTAAAQETTFIALGSDLDEVVGHGADTYFDATTADFIVNRNSGVHRQFITILIQPKDGSPTWSMGFSTAEYSICARGSQALCDRDGRIFFCDDRRQRSGSVMWTPRGLFHHS